MDWSNIIERYKNSVLQIICHRAECDPLSPFSPPRVETIYGTAFIIDISRGLLVTSAEIVRDAMNIYAKHQLTGKKFLKLFLIGICQDRNLAVCKFSSSSKDSIIRNKIGHPPSLNMRFGDNINLPVASGFMLVGFPNKADSDPNFKDIIFENYTSTYLNFAGVFNPGYLGGPVINKNGQVVAIAGSISARNSLDCVGSRSFISIFQDLINSNDGDIEKENKINIIKMPKLSIRWNKSNTNIIKHICGDDGFSGIYVNEVFPDSIFNKLDEGYIIYQAEFPDPFWADINNFDVTDIGKRDSYSGKVITILNKPKKWVLAEFDNNGDILLYEQAKNANGDVMNRFPLMYRKINIEELSWIIPLGTSIELTVCKSVNQWFRQNSVFENDNIYRIDKQYLFLEPLEYVIFAGLCVTPLTLNHIECISEKNAKKKLSRFSDKDRAFKKYLVVVRVFEESEAYRQGTLQRGDVINYVNEHRVRNIKELKNAVKTTGKLTAIGEKITVKTMDGKLFMADKNTFTKEDKESIRNNRIHAYEYLFS